MIDELKKEASQKMTKSMESLSNNLSKIRTGRAHPSILDTITVEYYGQEVPLNQVANIKIEDAKTLQLNVWEKNMIKEVEKSVISSDLGLIAPDQRLYANVGVDNDQQNVKPVTYSIVKTALIGLTRYLATYWANKGVRCNAMCPGGVENGQPEDFIKNLSSRIPMNRLAEAGEYQSTLLWMLSDASSYLNGAVVPVDGGRTAW